MLNLQSGTHLRRKGYRQNLWIYSVCEATYVKYAELNNAKYIIYLSNNTLKLFDSLVVEV